MRQMALDLLVTVMWGHAVKLCLGINNMGNSFVMGHWLTVMVFELVLLTLQLLLYSCTNTPRGTQRLWFQGSRLHWCSQWFLETVQLNYIHCCEHLCNLQICALWLYFKSHHDHHLPKKGRGHETFPFSSCVCQKGRTVIHTHMHRWLWLPCKVTISTPGAVFCPRTLWHAEQGNQTSNLPITRRWLYPLRHCCQWWFLDDQIIIV